MPMDPSLGLEGRGHATNVTTAITAIATAAPPTASDRRDVYRLRLATLAARTPAAVIGPGPVALCTLDRAILANHTLGRRIHLPLPVVHLGHILGAVSQAVQMLKCCLNPKVLIGIAVVAIGVILLAPDLISRAFPWLLALVCPLSMLLMMGSMAKMGGTQDSAQTSTPGPANAGAILPDVSVSPRARLALLRAQLQVLEEQRATTAAEIATLETPQALTPRRAVREVEQVARVAEGTPRVTA